MQNSGGFGGFGPWIERVRTEADLPRLYRDARIFPEEYRLVLKVPRRLDVGDATPDLHLYDYLVAVDDRAVTVLCRRGDRYDTLRLSADQIVAVEDSLNVLDGRLTLRTARGTQLAIPYNGVAGGTIGTLVQLIRQVYLPAGPGPDPYPPAPGSGRPDPDLGGRDGGLTEAYREVVGAQEFPARLVSAAPRRLVVPRSGRPGRILHRIRPVTLHASIALADDREIVVIHRHQWFTRGTHYAFSRARTVLPRARITGIAVHPHPLYERVDVVTVRASSACLEFPVPAGSDVAAMLSQLGPAADAAPLP